MERTKLLSVTVIEIRTMAYAQPENVTVVWGQAPVVMLYYIVAKNGSVIHNADITLNVTPECPAGAFIIEEKDVYEMRINASLLSIETYLVNVTLVKMFYKTGNIVIRVDIVPIPTYLALSQKAASLEYAEAITIKTWYYVYETGAPITDADSVKYKIYYEDILVLEGDMIYSSSDKSYEFTVNSSELINNLLEELGNETIELPITFTVYIDAKKSVYVPQEDVVTITVYDIACYADIPETEIVAEWAENVSIPFEIIRNKTLMSIKDVEIYVSGLPDGSWNLIADRDGYILIINTTKLEVVEAINKSYVITLMFTKPYHDIPSRTISLTVKKVAVDVSFVGTPPKVVEKWQIFEEAKTTNIDVLVEHKGIPVEDAEILAYISSVEAGINESLEASATNIPGVFRIAIKWQDYPPGYKWTIVIRVTKVKVYGVYVPSDKVIYSEISYIIKMDYVSGSTKISVPVIGEVYVANIFYYPMLAVFALLLVVAGYKGINWWLTPWEVKQINKILKMVNKGVFKYEAPERREFILEMLSDELGIES